MTPLDARERTELCDLFVALGPDAPTLCEGWTAFDLAAHLMVRERDPRSTPGILFGDRFSRLGEYTERLMERAKAKGFAQVVELVRTGPPLGPFRVPILREAMNLGEYFIHHEDVRRANGREPRTDRPDLDAALWKLLVRAARLQLRNVKGCTVTLRRPDGVEHRVGKGELEATVAGSPQELTLYLAGRRSAARVELEGMPAAIEELRTVRLGI